jgi:hypothetical protein
MRHDVRSPLAAFCALLTAFPAPLASAQVQWRSGTAPRSGQTRAQVVDVLATSGQRAAGRHVVVQFDRPVTPAQRATLQEAGLNLLDFLGDNAFFASTRPEALDSAVLLADVSLVDAQPLQVAWKLHPMLAAGEVPTWAAVPGTGVFDTQNQNLHISAYVMFQGDVTRPEAARVAAAHGVRVVSELKSLNVLVVEMPYSEIMPLAAEDAVQFIEPAMPMLEPVNEQNRALTGADVAQSVPYELDGSGVVVLVYDGGSARASHVDFGGRLTVYDTSSQHVHPTHVAGTIGGSGAASGISRRWRMYA